jgi:hypothetical protein
VFLDSSIPERGLNKRFLPIPLHFRMLWTMIALRVSAFALSLALLSCSSTADLRGVDSHDPAGKIDAIAAGDSRPVDAAMLRFLVAQLNSDDSAVRIAAISVLQRKTGQTLGFAAYDPPQQRNLAIAAWVDWVKKNSDQQHHGGPDATDTKALHSDVAPSSRVAGAASHG